MCLKLRISNRNDYVIIYHNNKNKHLLRGSYTNKCNNQLTNINE